MYQQKKGHWELGLNMTDQDVVEDFAELLDLTVRKRSDPNQGAAVIAQKKASGSTAMYKQQWRARTYARDKIYKIVSKFYPYMGERRRAKMDEFLAWYKTKNTTH